MALYQNILVIKNSHVIDRAIWEWKNKSLNLYFPGSKFLNKKTHINKENSVHPIKNIIKLHMSIQKI